MASFCRSRLHLWQSLFILELWQTRSATSQNAEVVVTFAEKTDASPWQPEKFLEVSYSEVLQPLVNVSVGGQWLQLVYDSSSAYAVAFMKEYDACLPKNLSSCYSYKAAEKHGGLHVCEDNNDPKVVCDLKRKAKFLCEKYAANLSSTTTHSDGLVIDGLEYNQQGLEALDQVQLEVHATEKQIMSWSFVPVRLLVNNLTASKAPDRGTANLELFKGADGILGSSGPTLSCRNTTLWNLLLQKLNVTSFFLDFHPPQASIFSDSSPSRIVFNEVDPAAENELLWSQPKQTGDMINDAMHEMLIYHPKVCGIDLLYNASSNWLTILDTSGPCLAFPPFLFDRLMTHIPVQCPFKRGEKSYGRLCSPQAGQRDKLPMLSFQLEDSREPEPSSIHLALERLIFRNSSGQELLCVSRQDTNTEGTPADMMYSHIAFGSMVASALHIVVDLQNATMGLASKGDPAAESSQAGCAKQPTCVGMQSFFPPLNLCEDPPCYRYLFMIVDQETKTCRWRSPIPLLFTLLLVLLVVLDLASHRLYKQAIQRAREYNQ
ncbi:unnamed protein product [Durusdinium trenchii]|uniref:Peptidase A1 domain-containing protein n=1 Tax=Durusdinium trenchii TaxID=1381693 RepID=A0ABP0J6L9_9DINO